VLFFPLTSFVSVSVLCVSSCRSGILTDYKSSTIDLNDVSVYRDLSKPVGALNEDRFEIYAERYATFDDPDIPPFFYGSHYSSAGIALYYLIRLEPYTSLAINLQGGHYDLADRLFADVQGAWNLSYTNVGDVKELIPEFFYNPEFLRNLNGLDLGTKQDKTKLGDVVLPPWANGSPEEFVRINRAALESEYVSAHLHEWIDLIFGQNTKKEPTAHCTHQRTCASILTICCSHWTRPSSVCCFRLQAEGQSSCGSVQRVLLPDVCWGSGHRQH
jgi:hypothetical protein